MDWSIDQGDCIEWLKSHPDDCVDLVFTSPPYELARTYLEGGNNLGIAKKTEDWVAWQIEVIRECSRICKGLVAFVVEGQTRNYRYSAGPLLLAADLHRQGFNLRKPVVFRRHGIPGGGGPDWLRNDWEPIICLTKPGKLPWSDNKAMGLECKYPEGGALSFRLPNGDRVNEHVDKDGKAFSSKRTHGRVVSHRDNSDKFSPRIYQNPTVANPGNVVQQTYTAREVAEMLGEPTDVVDCIVGGGQMGHPLAHENEAPFPLSLAEFFVKSFCPPSGIVCDPFSGSATTGHAAIANGRSYIGCDLRQSQVDLGRRRLGSVTPSLLEAV